MRELDYSNIGDLENDLNILEEILDSFFEISRFYKNLKQYYDNLENVDIPNETFEKTLERYDSIEEKMGDLSGNYFKIQALTDLFDDECVLFRTDINNIFRHGSAKFEVGDYLNLSDSKQEV